MISTLFRIYFTYSISINTKLAILYLLKMRYFYSSLTEHFLMKALEELNSGNLRPEQVLLDKLRPLERRMLPLAADILLAGVNPVSAYIRLPQHFHYLSETSNILYHSPLLPFPFFHTLI